MQSAAVPLAVQGQPWNSALFDCMNDCNSCCCVLWCTPCAYGQIVSMLQYGHPGGMCGDQTACCVYYLLLAAVGTGMCLSCSTRTQIRQRYGLAEEPCSDCCVHFWCEGCALCQEYRELEFQLLNRGSVPVVSNPAYATPVMATVVSEPHDEGVMKR